ncbi:hypothetical protein ES706_03265 [subsurface metagenome]
MDYEFEDKDDDSRNVENDLEMIREDLIGELQAINQYQQHIESLENEEVVTTLEHIMEEEKEHVAELLKILSVLDPIQAEKLNRQVWF